MAQEVVQLIGVGLMLGTVKFQRPCASRAHGGRGKGLEAGPRTVAVWSKEKVNSTARVSHGARTCEDRKGSGEKRPRGRVAYGGLCRSPAAEPLLLSTGGRGTSGL